MYRFNRILLLIISVASGLMSLLSFVMLPEYAGNGAYILTVGLAYVAAQAGHYASL